jgi:hypothetical protein
MKKKANLSEGFHDLVITHHKIKGTKVTFILTPVHQEANLVMRTFTFGSDALKSFMKELTGKTQPLPSEGVCKAMHGKMFRGLILDAQKESFMNLCKIVKVYNNGEFPVSELKSVGGSNDVGQTDTDSP